MSDGGEDLTAAWTAVQARLPQGWELDGLRCASTSLREGDRSDDWIAVAVGPSGAVRQARAGGPAAALDALVAAFERSAQDSGD